MSGIEITDGKIIITNGSRTVSTTDGTLLQFLTDEVEYNTTLNFLNPVKRQVYQWGGIWQTTPGGYFVTRRASSNVGAAPENTITTFNLAAKPSGADIFIGRVEFTRTKAPSHGWVSQPISPLLPQGVPVQINGGSMIVEAAFGIMRSVTFRVNDTHLIMERQQSVGPTAVFNSSGLPISAPTSSIPPNNVNRAYENISVGGPSLPVFAKDVLQEQNTYPGDFGGTLEASNFLNQRRYGFAGQLPYSDPTDYSTIYSVRIRGRYGRRS